MSESKSLCLKDFLSSISSYSALSDRLISNIVIVIAPGMNLTRVLSLSYSQPIRLRNAHILWLIIYQLRIRFVNHFLTHFSSQLFITLSFQLSNSKIRIVLFIKYIVRSTVYINGRHSKESDC